MKPVIGITPSPLDVGRPSGPDKRFTIGESYVNAVLAAGGIPVILPPQLGHNDQLLAMVDGLLFSGGADIDPAIYGDADVHPKTYGINPLRDEFELDLIREAVARDIPTLCICRGIQVLNVALGGSLIQDVPDQFSQKLLHQQSRRKIKGSEPVHEVEFMEGADRFGYRTPSVNTNSFHHQALKEIGTGLHVAARSEDGLVEAVYAPEKRCVLGVQWHPEMMISAHDEQLGPFTMLMESAMAARLAGRR